MSRAKSIKIEDPELFFSTWFFEIKPHHYGTLGLELRTFVANKVPYKSFASMIPPDYGFCQGHIFYERNNPNQYLQIGAEHGLLDLEVFSGQVVDGATKVTGQITSITELAHWLQTGEKPKKLRTIDFSQSKSGLMAWSIIGT